LKLIKLKNFGLFKSISTVQFTILPKLEKNPFEKTVHLGMIRISRMIVLIATGM